MGKTKFDISEPTVSVNVEPTRDTTKIKELRMEVVREDDQQPLVVVEWWDDGDEFGVRDVSGKLSEQVDESGALQLIRVAQLEGRSGSGVVALEYFLSAVNLNRSSGILQWLF